MRGGGVLVVDYALYVRGVFNSVAAQDESDEMTVTKRLRLHLSQFIQCPVKRREERVTCDGPKGKNQA